MNSPQNLADGETTAALHAAIANGMPSTCAAVFARWWQLETWLRELVYVELRALHGKDWSDAVVRSVTGQAMGRQSQDAKFTHMENADSSNPVAYLDYSQLLQVIDKNWDLFSYALIEKNSWDGRQAELKRIRHRIGHMRVPHDDDLSRLEQTLRDLETGTFAALASYNDHIWTPERWDDPVTTGWIHRNHEDAQRLIEHAQRQYDTKLVLRASRRPWSPRDPDRPGPGVLWHADFLTRGRSVEAAALWHDHGLDNIRPLLVHMVAQDPWYIGFTFSAADPADEIANAIGAAFDTVLTLAAPFQPTDLEAAGEEQRLWGERARGIDFRVIHNNGWTNVTESTLPMSNFGSGRVLRRAPSW